MTVVYTCDNNFVWIMGISMISLFENNKGMKDLVVYLLGDNVNEENKKILSSIAKKYDRECLFVDVPDLNIPKSLTSNRWPKSAFTRMFAGELMPIGIHQILYLDCDIIVKDSIAPLESYDTGSYAVTAVKDCVSKQYKKKIGIDEKDSYVNAGVLLMNLDKMRELDIRKMMANFVDSHKGLVSYADQDILNGMFRGKFGVLPPEYDVMTQMCAYTYRQILQYRRPSSYYLKEEIEHAQQNPIIIHYTTCMLNIRPWCKGSKHPCASEFDKYQRMSPWADVPKKDVKFDKLEHKIIRSILSLPDFVSYRLIGLLHATIRPVVIMMKARLKLGQ